MNHEIVVINWFVIILMVPAAIILVWHIISNKLKGNPISSDMMVVISLLALVVVGLIQLNLSTASPWTQLSLLLLQVALFFTLFKRIWGPFKQLFRG